MEIIIENFYAGKEVEEGQTKILLEYLKKFSTEDILFEIEQSQEKTEEISSRNISQFSDINAVDHVLDIVSNASETVTGPYVGYILNKNSSEGAQSRYGRDHLRLGIQMGLISEKPYTVTDLGKLYMELSDPDKEIIRSKLYLRVPIIQKLIFESKNKRINAMDELRAYLSEKTAVRRRSNINTLLDEISKISSVELQKQIMNNIYWS